jgi:D-glycero-beta-D-manno-heptose-7-phosphate kinase
MGRWNDDADLAARAQALLLTRAEEGMSLFDDNGELRVPAEARQVFDVTGAGDTVIATMAALLAAGLSPREAVPIANRAGGIFVSRFGTASVSYEELFP